ncbi:hypothetical protein VW29_19310 [Devosia limi DSM 17137]|uniref:Pyruvate/2-oxoglutarate dehydrogenase complex, dihydrolipoamide dehydrogenase (E3) component n=1 Tax=Devosia limi DSM 17137 TaxID=1121477 RepID=A0A0F5L586_9HYPH|nr:NAD(P)/FAD-dependent oxidoreductase [Devosia limi]KKB76797.1 hypothetical protein VW29_19310 [Devosia limi DSM 17137]SHF29295.1 Pyruvate/2-oxoglutarate dehydrogenase complex, dihydrolipoamide dehydrogenase (E3) component [Devosia limi DSM 17137]
MAEVLKPDLCIIGAGAAGRAAATIARRHGADVVLIDTGVETGDSLAAGALPAAALAAAAARAQSMRTASQFGITNDEPRPSFRAVHDHVQWAIAAIAPGEGVEQLRAQGIVVIEGPAVFVDSRTLKAGDIPIRARRFVLATGSQPHIPSIPGLDQVPSFTVDSIFANTHKLSHLVIIGGGSIALSLAQSHRRLGAMVTLLATGPLLPDFDPELVEVALRRLREEGVAIYADVEKIAIQPRSQGIGVTAQVGPGTESLDASHILIADGRQPNLDGLGLDAAGIRRDHITPQRLALGKTLTTSNRRVLAIGDAAWPDQSPQSARQQAARAVEHALFGQKARFDVAALPRLVAVDPEIVEIGLTELEARRRRKADYRVLRASFAENGRAIVSRQTLGTVKLMTDAKGVILGAALLGPGAGELSALFALALRQRIAVADLAELDLPEPSFATVVTRLGQIWRDAAKPDPWRQRLLALNRILP